jgi:hypothetical protein
MQRLTQPVAVLAASAMPRSGPIENPIENNQELRFRRMGPILREFQKWGSQ